MPQSPSNAMNPTREFEFLWSNLEAACAHHRKAVIPPATNPFLPHLVFGGLSNAEPYQLFGWNHPEKDYAWTEGTETVLDLPVPSQPGNYFLNARVAPLLTPSISTQRVQICLGTSCIAQWNVDCAGHYFALLFDSMLQSRQELTFRLPDARSPHSLGMGTDERELALRFYEIWLTPWLPVSF